MKKFRELSEAIKDKYDEGEYDQEGDMAKSDLRSIMANAKELHDMIDDADNLPEWCQNKITLAEDYISTVANYLTAEMNEEADLDEIAVVKTNKPIGTRVADIGSGGKEFNVKTNKAYDDAKKKKPQGAFFATQRRKERLASSGRMDEEIETLEEKNKPTNPELWSRAISLAKSKFDVYPSAYANGWASKWYKSKGGGWRTVSEAKDDNLPFTPDAPKKKSVVVGKKPEGYSIARQLARRAMQSQIEKLKKPVKEETHKAKIVKDIMKKKKDSSENAFQNEPELSSTLTKGF
jgi:hypothetical protein